MSNWRSESSLTDFLQRGKAVAIAEIDTRKLTRLIRDKGAQAGCIIAEENPDPEEAVAKRPRKFPGLKGMDLAQLVTAAEPYQWMQGSLWPERKTLFDKRVAG